MKFYRTETVIGNVGKRCQELLDHQTYHNAIRVGQNQYERELELIHSVGSSVIQTIIDNRQVLDTIRLQHPAPNILPIVISKILNDADSYIIPSDILNIHAILPYAADYSLEAVICSVNERDVVFIKHLPNNKWYYYQNNFKCEQFSENLSEDLDKIIRSTSVSEQIHLIKSAHFLISMIFYNAVKYIYKKEEQ